MTKASQQEILAIQERYKDLLVQPGDTVVPLEKKELLTLLQAGLSRGDHFGFNAGFGKLQPKVKSDGSKTIEFGFTAGFEEHLFADAGGLYGSGVYVTIELNQAPNPMPRPEERKGDAADPEGLNLPLPFEEEAPQPEGGAEAVKLKMTCAACGGLGYRGEGSEDSCEDCGGTGVIFQESSAPVTMPCPDCSGTGNVTDDDGALGPCLTCHSTGKVEVTEENDPYPDGHPADYADDEPVPDETPVDEDAPDGNPDPSSIS